MGRGEWVDSEDLHKIERFSNGRKLAEREQHLFFVYSCLMFLSSPNRSPDPRSPYHLALHVIEELFIGSSRFVPQLRIP